MYTSVISEEDNRRIQVRYNLREISVSFFFLWPYLRHVEVPRPGVKLELQLQAYTTAMATPDLSRICDPGCYSLQQHWIFNPLSEARD